MNPSQRNRPGLWLSTAVSIVGLLLVVLFSYIAERTLDLTIHSTLRTLISLLIAFVPPLIWLTVFYRQDRLDPEPKSFVFKTLILGALVQKALYAPVISVVMPEAQAGPNASDYILSVVLVALIQESMKLLSVRYSIYVSKEFDEKIDGIIYGSALGLGFAAMTNLDMIIRNGGSVLTAISSIVVIESLAHASFTGLSCYFLGQDKFGKFNMFRLPGAVVLATALNALSRILIDDLVRDGFRMNYMLGIIPAALLAVVIFGILVILTFRTKGKEEGTAMTKRQAFLSVLPVWVLLIAAMITGFAIKNAPIQTATVSLNGGIRIAYPSSWTQSTRDDYLFMAVDLMSGGGQNFVSVKEVGVNTLISLRGDEGTPELEDIGAAWAIRTGREYRFYQAVKSYPLQFNGLDTYVIEYIYISDNKSPVLGSKSPTPGIGYSRDIITASGDQVYVITVSTSYNDWILKKDNLEKITLSLGSN
ncbi:MAG TPA: PrsW family glutamic-type intramembrane protease [Thermoclostridium caenicola]|nr:PrsW family glutamic-type intramembrane protease [Thermoclostridium caenicola]